MGTFYSLVFSLFLSLSLSVSLSLASAILVSSFSGLFPALSVQRSVLRVYGFSVYFSRDRMREKERERESMTRSGFTNKRGQESNRFYLGILLLNTALACLYLNQSATEKQFNKTTFTWPGFSPLKFANKLKFYSLF